MAAARRTGAVRRARKVDIYVLVWTLVLGIHIGARRSLDGLRQLYQRAGRHRLTRSAFYDRLSPAMAKLMRDLVADALAAQPPGPRHASGPLSTFTELLAIDTTVLKLHRLLQRAFPGTNGAAAKLHVVMNVFDGSAKKVKLTSELVADTAPWKRVGPWVRDRLLLFDLGYYRFHLFHCIDDNGGFFITRAKSNFNPVIVGLNRSWRGRSIDVVGDRLLDVLPRLQRAVLDVDVEVTYDKRVYNGVRSTVVRTFRLVAVRNAQTGDYHVYLTNIAAEQLAGADVGQTYRLRWQAELLFKALKSHGQLDELPSRKPSVVACLVWASVLCVIVRGVLYRLVRAQMDANRHLPPLRFAALFARWATALLELVVAPPTAAHQWLWRHLLAEAPDPNVRRPDRALARVPAYPDG
jgi:IS4 transposase